MEVTAIEFRELSGCNSLCLNKSGSLALISGRRVFGLVRLDKPEKLAKKIRRTSKYDVSASAFSPHRDEICAVASNDKIELIDWSGLRDMNLQAIIKAHSRIVTDLSWHCQQTDLLATSSVDSNIFVWDTRDVRKASISLSSVTGASQIVWEKLHGKILASSHEGEIKLWDIRKGSTPTQTYINAHYSKIYSLDFSPIRPEILVSSSYDSTLKCWDIKNPRSHLSVLKFPTAPVWKTKFTPFGGDGILTLTIHGALHRAENNLMLWNAFGSSNAPEFTFSGHQDMILEFDWRHSFESYDNYLYHQLVSWSKNQTLRIWSVGPNLRALCGNLTIPEPKLNETLVKSFEDNFESKPSPSPQAPSSSENHFESSEEDEIPFCLPSFSNFKNDSNLQQEFSLLNFGEKLNLDTLDLKARFCIIIAQTLFHYIILKVIFPLDYPGSDVPIFHFLEGTTLDASFKSTLLRKLKLTAHQQVAKARLCLEMCLRVFENSIERLYDTEEENRLKAIKSSSNLLGGYQDSNIPFPRTSGARFCGLDSLICFGYAYNVMLPSVSKVSTLKVPRSLTAVTLSNPSSFPHFGQSPSIKSRAPRVRFGSSVPNGKSRLLSTGSLPQTGLGNTGFIITIYNVSSIIPFHRKLAEKSLVSTGDKTLVETCQSNYNTALFYGRKDYAKIWKLVLRVVSSERESSLWNSSWGCHPLGQKLLGSIIDYFIIQQDIQMAALLSCVFFEKNSSCEEESSSQKNIWDSCTRKNNSKSECSNDTGREISLEPPHKENCSSSSQVIGPKHIRSNSDSQSLEDFRRLLVSGILLEQVEQIEESNETSFYLDPSKAELYDSVKKAYSEMCLHLKLIEKSIEVRKCLHFPFPEESRFVTLTTRECKNCHKMIRGGSHCRICNTANSTCALCDLPTKGLSSICVDCGHGGHLEHIITWFEDHSVCPSGCGCFCSFNN